MHTISLINKNTMESNITNNAITKIMLAIDNRVNYGGIISRKTDRKNYTLYTANKEISFCNHTYFPRTKDNNQLIFTYSALCKCEEKIYNAYRNGFSSLIIITDTEVAGLYSLYCKTQYLIDVYEVSKDDVFELILPKIIKYDENIENKYSDLFDTSLYLIFIIIEIFLGTFQFIYIIIYFYIGIKKGGTITFYSGSKEFRYSFYFFSSMSIIFLILNPIFNIRMYKTNVVTEKLIKNLSLSFTIFTTILVILSWTKRYILNYNASYLKTILKIIPFFSCIYIIFIIVQLTVTVVYFIYYIYIPYMDYLMFSLVCFMSLVISSFFTYLIYDTKDNRKASILVILYLFLSIYVGSLVFTQKYVFAESIINHISFIILFLINHFNAYFIEPKNLGIIYSRVG